MAKLIKFRATVCNPCKMLDQAIKDLGIEIDEDYVKERAKESHNWKNPIWKHKDGSIAEW